MATKEIIYKTLENISLENIYKCAVDIFSDVKPNGDIDNYDYEKRLIDGCYSKELSYGAFFEDKLIAMVVVGVNQYQGRTSAYNIITGSLQEHREKKIATNLLQTTIQNLKKNKIESFFLEVMSNNSSAIRTYQKCGFETTRTLMSFMGTKIKSKRTNVKKQLFSEFDFSRTEKLKTFPMTFTNSFQSMNQRRDELDVYYVEKSEAIAAMLVLDNKNNTVRYYAANENRDGIDKIIKKIFCDKDKVFFKDFDSADKELIKLLNHEGFKNIANQYEMKISLE